MFNEEEFLSVGLHVVELAPDFQNETLYYRIFLKELPQLTGEGFSKREAYTKLTQNYLNYRNELVLESDDNQDHPETTTMLSLEQLLHYYDGETFDGFKIFDQTEE